MTDYRPGLRVFAVFRDGATVEDELIENTRGDLCAALGTTVVHLLDRDRDGRLKPAPHVASIRPATPPTTVARLTHDLTGLWADRNGDLWVCDGKTARCARSMGLWRTHTTPQNPADLDRLGPFITWKGDE